MLKKLFYFQLLILGFVGFSLCQNRSTDSQALFDAVRRGNLSIVLTLLGQGMDVNVRGEYGYTPLIVATKYDQTKIAQELCARGADVNAQAGIDYWSKEWGYTPLLWAAKNSNLDMAGLLIAKGANVGRRGATGDLPLIVAAHNGSLALAEMLLSKGALVDARDEESGETALIAAVEGGYLDLADYLIEAGADIQIRSQGGRSLFLVAAYRGHYAAVRYFHEKGFSVSESDRIGQTAMHFAVTDSVEARYILNFLIENDANVSAKDSGGVTPLMLASYNGVTAAMEVLIAKGAAVNDRDNQGNTPLHCACQWFGSPEPARKVKRREAVLRLLIDKGAEINARNCAGTTPLMDAARYQHDSSFISTLLDSGAQINAKDSEGRTALMYAAEWNQTANIGVLASRGADLNLRNSKGETALARAKNGTSSFQAYELLKSLGAKGE